MIFPPVVSENYLGTYWCDNDTGPLDRPTQGRLQLKASIILRHACLCPQPVAAENAPMSVRCGSMVLRKSELQRSGAFLAALLRLVFAARSQAVPASSNAVLAASQTKIIANEVLSSLIVTSYAIA